MQGGQTNLFNADKNDKSTNEAGQVAVIRSLSFEGNCIIDATTEIGMSTLYTMIIIMSLFYEVIIYCAPT